MKRIPIEEATPGMHLAKPATNSTGQTILAAGVELDETLIARVRRLGVSAIYVDGGPNEEAHEKPLAELEQELDHRFRKAAGDPLREMIREAIRRHLSAARDVKPFAGGGPQP